MVDCLSRKNQVAGELAMNAIRRLAAATMVGVFFFAAANMGLAAEPAKKESTKSESKPASTAKPASAASSTSAAKQAATINSQRPAGPSSSTKPNEQMKAAAAKGWDTKATDKGVVKSTDTRVDPQTLIKQGNAQKKQEDLRTAQRFPAVGKAPPPPEKSAKNDQPTNGPKAFFNKLFGK